MGKKKLRKRIASLEKGIREHEEKIRIENEKPFPDAGVIHHWQAEINAFKGNMAKAKKRLSKGG